MARLAGKLGIPKSRRSGHASKCRGFRDDAGAEGFMAMLDNVGGHSVVASKAAPSCSSASG